MMNDLHQKVQASHLKRNAYLYVRQSTLRQVFENTESTKRQYGLRQRAVALGWAEERVIVIDSDLGQSGASSDREGFQHLVAEVGMGHAGIVLGLEVSRLARNSMDWHRLLEICALTATLICDEDGVYDPAHFNDRLLLGLKGTMSEAELHVLRARLQGGILNKARRGELEMRPPVGLVYNGDGALVLDPDRQVQHCLKWLFATFARTGSASATVKAARQERLAFPHRCAKGAHKGELMWDALDHSQVLRALHNPRYAGAFMVRLLLEDVTLNRDEQISLQIRFKGGACRTLHLPLPLCAWQQRVTPPRVIDEIDHLLDDHTVAQIADILNARGMTPGAGASFHPQLVARLARTYHLKPRYDRLRERGLLTQLRRGLLRGHAYSDKNESLYEPPGDNAPSKTPGAKLSLRRLDARLLSDRAKEVQYET
jgi:DNA invertase Pin-like site-specific DNA recombinase